MPAEDRPRQIGDRIDTLFDALGAGGAVARGRAEELVREVADLYGAGLDRILEILKDRGALDPGHPGRADLRRTGVRLLLIHGLHPQDLQTRVAAALDSVRPYLGSHGGDVELLEINDDGVVRLSLLGTCQGCPSSSVTLKFAVEEAIEVGCPGSHGDRGRRGRKDRRLAGRDPRGRAAGPAEPGSRWFRGRPRPAMPAAGRSTPRVPGSPCPSSPSWNPGRLRASWSAAGIPLLACRTGQDVYAYRDYCPRCTRSMDGATLQRALAAPVGGGLLRCPSCRAHFDVRQAGACLEDRACISIRCRSWSVAA